MCFCVNFLFAQNIDNVIVIDDVQCFGESQELQISFSGIGNNSYDLQVCKYNPSGSFCIPQPALFINNVSSVETVTLTSEGDYEFDLVNNSGTVVSNFPYETSGWPEQLSYFLLTNNSVSCFGGNDGSISGLPGGGTVNSLNDYSFSWSGPNNYSSNSEDINNLQEGTYLVTVSDLNNCLSPPTAVQVTQPENLIASSSVTSNFNGFSIDCNGNSTGQASVSISGGTQPYNVISWSGPNNYSSNSQNISGLSVGNYNVIVTDANDCQSNNSSINLTQPSSVQIELSADDVSCNTFSDGSITSTINGGVPGYSYNWSGPNGFSSISQNVNGIVAGQYSLDVSDANGCVSSNSINITEPDIILFNATVSSDYNGEDVSCSGVSDGSISLNIQGGTPGYNVSLDGGLTNSLVNQNSSINILGLSAVSYELLVTDQQGCSSVSQQILLTSPAPIVANPTPINPSCSEGDDGSITIFPTGGVPGYQIQWTNSLGTLIGTTNTINNLTAGIYNLTIQDQNNCIQTSQIVLTDPSPIQLLNVDVIDISCFGADDGQINNVVIAGGQPGYQYSWTGVNQYTNSQLNITSLIQGQYILSVTDANDCVSQPFSFNIDQPESIDVNIITSHLSCSQNSTGILVAQASGGNPNYSYSWTGPNNSVYPDNDVITNLDAGAYNLIVTDANNCSQVEQVILTEPDPLVLNDSISNTSCFGSTDGEIFITPDGGTAPYVLTNNVGDVVLSPISNVSANPYQYTVTDANGCFTQITSIVEEPLQLLLNPSVLDADCYLGSDGQITINPTGGTGNYSLTFENSTQSLMEGQSLVFNQLENDDYTFLLSDDSGCQVEETVNVSESSPILISTFPNNVSVNGLNDGSITTIVSGGAGGYTFSWIGPSFTSTANNIFNLSPGNYVLTVTDINGCSRETVVSITEPDCAVNITVSETLPNCFGDNAQINWSLTGGLEPYTNTLVGDTDNDGVNETIVDNQQFSSPPTGGYALPAPGNYILQVEDAGGCVGSYNFDLTSPELLVVGESSISHVSCNGGQDGVFVANVTGGTMPYSNISYSGLNSNPNPNALQAGIYQVEVTDANDCQAQYQFEILEPDSITAQFLFSDPSCDILTNNSGSDGSITVVPSGGTNNSYTYLWDDPATQSTQTANNLTAGVYQVTISSNNCFAQFSQTLSPPTPINIDPIVSITDIDCFNSCTGGFSVNATGGLGSLSFNWFDVNNPSVILSNTQNIDNLCAGSYSFTVEDENNCYVNSLADPSIQPQLTLVEPNPFSISTNITNASLNGLCDGSASVNVNGGTPPFSYSWSDGSTGIGTSNLCSGIYTVDVLDANNCQQTELFSINEPSCDVSLLVNTLLQPECPSDSGQIVWSVQGGVAPYTSFLISGSDTVYSNSGNFANWTSPILPVGTYSLVVIDDGQNNCTDIYNFSIVAPQPLLLSLSSISGVSCFGDNPAVIELSAIGGTPNNNGDPYSIDNGSIQCAVYMDNTGIPTNIIGNDPIAGGNYLFSFEDANNCLSNILAVNVPLPTEIIPSLSFDPSSQNVVCPGDSSVKVSLNVTGGSGAYTVNWNSSSSVIPFNTTDFNIEDLPSGDYSVTVDDGSGCPSVETIFSIGELDPIELNILAQNLPTCHESQDAFVSLEATGGNGGFTYLWAPTGNTNSFSNSLSSGDYLITVTDQNNCYDFFNINVPETPEIQVSIQETNPISCHQGGDGELSVFGNILNGTPPYTYQWFVNGAAVPQSLGGNSPILADLSANTYEIEVTDAEGCTQLQSFTLIEPSPLNISINNFSEPICFGGFGSADIVVSGGNAPYSYNWIDDSNTIISSNSFTNQLTSGIFTVEVFDNTACIGSIDLIVNEPSEINISIQSNDVSCYGGSDGSAIAAVSGGVGLYQYSWDNFNNSILNTMTNVSAGIYSLTVEDQNNCQSTQSIEIIEPPKIQITTSTTMVSCYGGNDAEAMVSAIGGVPPYSYAWGDGQSGNLAQSLNAGVISLLIADANQCPLDTILVIEENTPINLTTSSTISSCSDGLASVSASGGVPGYSYLWSTGAQSDIITGLTSGSYTVIVTDQNGCDTTAVETIAPPNPILGTISIVDSVSCYDFFDANLSVDITSGNPPYSYSINNGVTFSSTLNSPFIIPNLSQGFYTVIVKDADDCFEEIGTVNITQPESLMVSTTASNISCYGFNDGNVLINSSGGTGPFDYSLDNGMTSYAEDTTSYLNIDSLSVGQYICLVTDKNGCEASSVVMVNEPDELIVSSLVSSDFNGSHLSCNDSNDGTISVVVDGGILPYNYDINILGYNQQLLYQDSYDFEGLAAGEHIIQVIDANNCIVEQLVNIIPPDSLTLDVEALSVFGGGYQISCFGAEDGVIELTSSGGVQPYDYSSNGGVSFEQLEQGNSFSLNNLSAGQYTFVVRDVNNCETFLDVSLVSPEDIVIDISVSSDYNGHPIQCYNGSNAELTSIVSGGVYPFDYIITSVMDQISLENQDSVLVLQNLTAGNYIYDVVDANGCQMEWTPASQVFVTQPEEVDFSYFISPISCTDDTDAEVQFSDFNGGTGNYEIEFWNSFGFYENAQIFSVNTIETYSGLTSAMYYFSIIDDNNCQHLDSILISNPLPINSSVEIFNASCFNASDGSVTISLEGGTIPYTLSYNGQEYETNEQDFSFENLNAQEGIIMVYDANLCQSEVSFNVGQPLPISPTLSTVNVVCNGDATGEVELQITGGTSPYVAQIVDDKQVLISTGLNTVGLDAGDYLFIITDNNDCVETVPFSIDEEEPLIVNIDSVHNQSCSYLNDGLIAISVFNNQGPYEVFWSHAASQETTVGDLMPGDYSFVVIDDAGCYATDSVVVSSIEEITIQTNFVNASCINSIDGQIEMDVLGGTPPFNLMLYEDDQLIQEENSVSFTAFIELMSNDYQLVAIDQNNCVQEQNITLLYDGGYDCLIIEPTFSPNFDGENDYFSPAEFFDDEVELFIFNRWGQQVYYNKSVKPSWNGFSSSGELLPTADYYYIVKFNNETLTDLTGVITLIK